MFTTIPNWGVRKTYGLDHNLRWRRNQHTSLHMLECVAEENIAPAYSLFGGTLATLVRPLIHVAERSFLRPGSKIRLSYEDYAIPTTTYPQIG